MKNTAVFGFYGESDSGKTSLIVKVIKRLSNEKLKVATVKISDKNIGMDTDTWKHNQAGSLLTVLSSPIETDFIIKQNKNIEEIIQNIEKLIDCDVILIEGANDSSIPKIKIGNIQERENTIMLYDGKIDSITELIKDEIEKRKVDEK